MQEIIEVSTPSNNININNTYIMAIFKVHTHIKKKEKKCNKKRMRNSPGLCSLPKDFLLRTDMVH